MTTSMGALALLEEPGWKLDNARCPCDVDFVNWLAGNNVHDSSILHMGTGLHHLVGLSATARHNNAVLGLTISGAELHVYENLVRRDMRIAQLYQVRFGDIYFADRRLFPKFHYITAFHFGEGPNHKRQEAGGMTDDELANFLISRLRPGGRLLLYTGSTTFNSTAWPIFSTKLKIIEDFKHLRVMGKLR